MKVYLIKNQVGSGRRDIIEWQADCLGGVSNSLVQYNYLYLLPHLPAKLLPRVSIYHSTFYQYGANRSQSSQYSVTGAPILLIAYSPWVVFFSLEENTLIWAKTYSWTDSREEKTQIRLTRSELVDVKKKSFLRTT